MRKLLALLAVLMLAVGLVACGDDKKEDEGKEGEETRQGAGDEEEADDEEEAAGEKEGDEEEAATDGEFSSNEKLNELLTLLEANGLEVNVISEDNLDVIGSTHAVMVEVNGDDLFTFEAFELEEGHENLSQVEETGQVTMEFDGMEGEVPAWSKGNFVFMLPEGHANYDEIVDIVDNEFDVE